MYTIRVRQNLGFVLLEQRASKPEYGLWWLQSFLSNDAFVRPMLSIHYIVLFLGDGRVDVLCGGSRRFLQLKLTPYGCSRDIWEFGD